MARVYDYFLGGSHNFASDRQFAEVVIRAAPDVVRVARENRDFLGRVVRFECARGIEQFLDLGSGIPTVGNVHEVARAANPRSRVVYVDHDPIAIAHSRALLAGDRWVTAIPGDVRRPDRVLVDAVGTGLLDLDRPIAMLMVSLLHFVADADRPADIVTRYLRAVGPGSGLALSHGRHDCSTSARQAARIYREEPGSPSSVHLRSHAEISGFFAGLTMVEPGLVAMPLWRPEPAAGVLASTPDVTGYPFLAGLGHKP